jgi:alkylhydroperoxidase/carboxymuconolactone decarboxylase family protein YurZ
MGEWDELPSGAGHIARTFPEVWNACAKLGEACAEAGPLDERTRRLVKLALLSGLRRKEPSTPTQARRWRKDLRPRNCSTSCSSPFPQPVCRTR